MKPTGLGLVAAPALLTVREVAAELRVKSVTVYRLVAVGTLPCIRVSNAIRVRREDLEAFIGRGLTSDTQAASPQNRRRRRRD